MQGKTRDTFDVTDRIVAFKRSLASRHDRLKRAYVEVKDCVSRAPGELSRRPDDRARGRLP